MANPNFSNPPSEFWYNEDMAAQSRYDALPTPVAETFQLTGSSDATLASPTTPFPNFQPPTFQPPRIQSPRQAPQARYLSHVEKQETSGGTAQTADALSHLRTELDAQRFVIEELSDCFADVNVLVNEMQIRMNRLENENYMLRTNRGRGRHRTRSRSPSYERSDFDNHETLGNPVGPIGAIPTLNAPMVSSSHALPAHSTATSRAPAQPAAPTRALPIARPGSSFNARRGITNVSKRVMHNLDRLIAPTNVMIPAVPLTDVEVIVYFFNSLSRPLVSLRLYARKWGPALIVDVLNSHRDVVPPYLRNTCSVKCTTALKQGRKRWTNDWEIAMKGKFAAATTAEATTMVQMSGEEAPNALDFHIKDLCNGLKKHPEKKQEGHAGIFTQCVEYCQKHDANFLLSNVVQLATDLQAGIHPRPPPTQPTNLTLLPAVVQEDEAMENIQEDQVMENEKDDKQDDEQDRDQNDAHDANQEINAGYVELTSEESDEGLVSD